MENGKFSGMSALFVLKPNMLYNAWLLCMEVLSVTYVAKRSRWSKVYIKGQG